MELIFGVARSCTIRLRRSTAVVVFVVVSVALAVVLLVSGIDDGDNSFDLLMIRGDGDDDSRIEFGWLLSLSAGKC